MPGPYIELKQAYWSGEIRTQPAQHCGLPKQVSYYTDLKSQEAGGWAESSACHTLQVPALPCKHEGLSWIQKLGMIACTCNLTSGETDKSCSLGLAGLISPT